MQRKDFLRSLGIVGIGSMLAVTTGSEAVAAMARKELKRSGCVLIPSETRGPYPLDLSSDSSMFRRAINEDKNGLALQVDLTIVNVNDNCAPLPNVRVDVWHCDKDGVYSGYSQPGANTVGQTFCRGIQMSDANGRVQFNTVYPGWYNGRTTHIHFEMYLSSVLSATSQLCFPDALNKQVYATSQYAAHGQNTSVASNSADNVFGDGSVYQTASVSENPDTGGLIASLVVGIAAAANGLIDLEPETGGQFQLLQNFPNPFVQETRIPFLVHNPALVLIELFDVQGKKIATLLDDYRDVGEHHVGLDARALELSDSAYIYQLSTTNSYGTFRQSKVLTRA